MPPVQGTDQAWTLSGTPVVARFTGRVEGDLAGRLGPDPSLDARRRALAPGPWTWLRQVHGSRVVVVGHPGDGAGEEADAAVSAHPSAVLAVFVADCAPVAFGSPEGIFGVAHAGWRGLRAGVIAATVEAMEALGATEVRAALGPCIHAECYAFGPQDLDQLAGVLGDTVRGHDRHGRPALDLPAAVRVAVERSGAELEYDAGVCTACSGAHWSWRADRDDARQAAIVTRMRDGGRS